MRAVLKPWLLPVVVVLASTTPARASSLVPTLTSALASATTVSYLDPLALRGTVSSRAYDGDRTVVLLRVRPDGSRLQVASTHTDSAGRYRFALPTRAAGSSAWVAQAWRTTHAAGADSATVHVTVVKDPTTISTTWTHTEAALGSVAVATGRVAGTVHGDRRVRILLGLPSGWRVVARTRTASDGSYRVAMANGWLHDAPVRTEVAPTAGMTGATGVAVRSHVVPDWTPAGHPWTYRLMGDLTGSYRMNPCQVLGWRLNDAAGTHLADAREGVRRLTQATGLRFRYLGTTAHDPAVTSGWPAATDGVPTTLIIGFGPDRATAWPLGADLGEGSPLAVRWARSPLGLGMTEIVASGAWVNTSQVRDHGFDVGDLAGQVILHELGHAVGLLHPLVDVGQSQRMTPGQGTLRAARWGAGDLAALRLVGRQQGCVTEVAAVSTAWLG